MPSLIRTDPHDALNGFRKQRNALNSLDLKNEKDRLAYAEAQCEASNIVKENRDGLISIWNSNAIDAALQRQIILQGEGLEAFATVLANLDIFTTVFSNVPLEGTDKVEVPYFPLQATASTSFVKGTGYTTSSDWTENSREISVGGDGNSATSGANAAAGTARDRKYQMLNFTSYDLARIPYLQAARLVRQAANKLAVDIFTDIVGRVVVAGNFSSRVVGAANVFGADVVSVLREDCTGKNWPQFGRTLVLDHTYYTPLLQDPSFKSYLSYGATDPIQKGRINNIYGFENIVEIPNLAASYGKAGEYLAGWINFKSAVLCAIANVMPSDAVRNISGYETYSNPMGISFAHRKIGDAVKDITYEVIEASYGASKGIDTSLERLASQ